VVSCASFQVAERGPDVRFDLRAVAADRPGREVGLGVLEPRVDERSDGGGGGAVVAVADAEDDA